MTTSMTRRQFLGRALGTLAITSSCTAIALRPKAKTKLGILWSPTFVVDVSDADCAMAHSWIEAFERKLWATDPDRGTFRIHEIARLESERVWMVSVSAGRFVQVPCSDFYRA